MPSPPKMDAVAVGWCWCWCWCWCCIIVGDGCVKELSNVAKSEAMVADCCGADGKAEVEVDASPRLPKIEEGSIKARLAHGTTERPLLPATKRRRVEERIDTVGAEIHQCE